MKNKKSWQNSQKLANCLIFFEKNRPPSKVMPAANPEKSKNSENRGQIAAREQIFALKPRNLIVHQYLST